MSAAKRPVTMNFASVNYRFLGRVRTGLVLTTVALLVTAIVLIAQTRSQRDRAADRERELAELAASLEKMKPAIEERERLVKNLSAMSALLEARKFSWVRLLTGLESSFPAGVALNALSIEPKGNVLSLEGTASSPEALSSLMIGLQNSRSFRSPKLKRQSLDKGNLEFHVDVVYQDAPAGVASGQAERHRP